MGLWEVLIANKGWVPDYCIDVAHGVALPPAEEVFVLDYLAGTGSQRAAQPAAGAIGFGGYDLDAKKLVSDLRAARA